MPKDSGADGDASRPTGKPYGIDQPPPYSVHEVHESRGPGANGRHEHQRAQNMSALNIWAAPPSLHDTESLLRHAQLHGDQLHQLSRKTQRYLRHWNKANLAIEQVLLMRSTVIHVRNLGYDQRRFVIESQNVFLQEAKEFLDSLPPGPSLDKLRTLHDRVKRDHDRRSQHVAKTQETELEISDKEYKLQKSISRLAEDVKALFDIVSTVDLPEIPIDELSAPSTITEAEVEKEDEIPGIVLHYFEKLGDVSLEQERLMNLELEHQEKRVNRMTRMDQGRPPSTTHSEFENAFSQDYEVAQKAYDEAVGKVNLAWAVCLGEDLNPDDFRKPPSETERDPSRGPPSNAAAVSDTSSGKHVREEYQVPTAGPVFEQLAQAGNSSIYSAWPLQSIGATSPAEERVQTWLRDQFLPNPWDYIQARRRSLSEARIAPLEVNDARSTDRVNISFQAHKRASSESERYMLHSRYDDREEVFNGLRGFAIEL